MKAVLDLHDFSVANNRLDLLLKLKEHFDNFKVSMFTVPYDKKEDWGPTLIHDDNLKLVKENLDWIQLIPHGLHHDRREAGKWDYEIFKHKILPEIKAGFNNDGLPFENGFCAPHWVWSSGVVKHLDEIGWWGAVLREDKMVKTKRFYRYNFLLDEPFWLSVEPVLKLHGHVYGTKNDIGKCFNNLMRLPKDTEWHFVTDYIDG